MHQPITTTLPDQRAGRTLTHTAALLTNQAPVRKSRFQELLDERDEASEYGGWNACDGIDDELRTRRLEASIALNRVFVDAVNTIGTLPWVEGGKLATCEVLWYLAEALDGKSAAMLVCDEAYRFEVIASLAQEYVKEHGEELLVAGYEPEVLP